MKNINIPYVKRFKAQDIFNHLGKYAGYRAYLIDPEEEGIEDVQTLVGTIRRFDDQEYKILSVTQTYPENLWMVMVDKPLL